MTKFTIDLEFAKLSQKEELTPFTMLFEASVLLTILTPHFLDDMNNVYKYINEGWK